MRLLVRASRLAAAGAALAALVLAMSIGAARAADMGDLRPLVLHGSWPEIGKEPRATSAGASGAGASVVLSIRQDQWEERGDQMVHNVRRFRRVKVLDAAAAARLAHYETRLAGALRPEAIKARTVTVNGRSQVVKEAKVSVTPEGDGQVVAIDYADVTAGAYLDLYIATNRDERYFFLVEPFQYQEDLPVLAAHFLFSPPDGLDWASAFQGSPKVDPKRVTAPNKREYRVFSFDDVPPLPRDPHLPPAASFARTLFIRPNFFSDNRGNLSATVNPGAFAIDIGPGWAAYTTTNARLARSALSAAPNLVPAAAVAAAQSAATPLAKIEAVRHAMAAVRVPGADGKELIRHPNDVLRFGRGHHWLRAQAEAEALRRAGLAADVLETRRRTDGPLPQAFPLPALLDQYVIRVKLPEGPTYYVPGLDLPAGTLPVDLRGATAIVLAEGTAAPIQLPPVRLAENRVARKVTGRVEPDGRVIAETVGTLGPVAAAPLRARLRAADPASRATILRDDLRRALPTAEVREARFDNLDDAAAPLGVTYAWEAPNAARVDGNELHLDAVFYDRWDATAWPEGERSQDVDFGLPFETDDQVQLQLPPGVKKVFRVEEVRAEILDVGLFEAIDTTTVKRISLRRHVRLDSATIPASIYPSVRTWLADLARFDGAATVARIGPEVEAAPEPDAQPEPDTAPKPDAAPKPE